MARPAAPRSLQDLRVANNVQDQIAALKRLKNDLIGHEQRKEACIQCGIVDTLVQLLGTRHVAGAKRRRASNDADNTLYDSGSPPEMQEGSLYDSSYTLRQPALDERWTHEDELRLQCTIIAGSLAQGGLPYVQPLVVGGISQPLLFSLSLVHTHPILVKASLRVILTCMEALDSGLQSIDLGYGNSIADEVFSRVSSASLADILAQRAITKSVIEQQSLVMRLLVFAQYSQRHQQNLLRAGVLELLSAKLSAYIVAAGLTKTADSITTLDLPYPPPKTDLVNLIEAINSTIGHSTYRCAKFVYDPTISGVFAEYSHSENNQGQDQEALDYDYSVKAPYPTSAASGIDELIPQIPQTYAKPTIKVSTQWPPLSTMIGYHRGDTKDRMQHNMSFLPLRSISEEFGSQLITWLLYISRNSEGHERLAAVWLLVMVIRAKDKILPDRSQGDMSPARNRERVLASLVVPLLVGMIEDGNNDAKHESSNGFGSASRTAQGMQDRVMLALGHLIEDSPALQRAAVEAGAIKLLCQILKRSFDPVTDTRKPIWHPGPMDEPMHDADVPRLSPTQLGQQSVCQGVPQALRRRAAAMQALADLGQLDDTFRKMIIEQGTVTCTVDSLIAYDNDPAPRSQSCSDALIGKKGNPVIVLVAACKLARALSRSVNILRTSLIDGRISQPILGLLQYPNAEVKRQAAKVACNLLLHFSPMRDGLVKGGCLKILCDHAHSTDPELQTTALWALKHLVSAAPTELKTACLEELGVGWFLQILRGDIPRGSAAQGGQGGKLAMSRVLGSANAAGEQVDLLNSPADEAMMDMDSAEEAGFEDEPLTIAGRNDKRYDSQRPGDAATTTTFASRQARLRLLKTEEQSSEHISWSQSTRVQHHALDFLRNLIGDPQANHYDMIDYVFGALSRETLFQILLEKMRAGDPRTALSPREPVKPPHAGRELPRPANMPTTMHASSKNGAGNLNAMAGVKAHTQPPAGGQPNHPAQLPLPADLLQSTIFILVHIANGRSSQRQHLIAHKELIAATLPLFGHPDRQVRLACLWLMQNLLWIDSGMAEDQAWARERARDLRALGVDEKAREALRDDDLDVHQRAKGVIERLERLLGSGGGGGGGGGVGSGDVGMGGMGSMGTVGAGAGNQPVRAPLGGAAMHGGVGFVGAAGAGADGSGTAAAGSGAVAGPTGDSDWGR